MKAEGFLSSVRDSGMAVVTLKEAARMMGKPVHYASIYISRLTKHGDMISLGGGHYAVRGADPFAVASSVALPSYVSFSSAFTYHKAITRIPRVVWVATSRQHGPFPYAGYEVKFVKLASRRMFGFEKQSLGGRFAYIADFEKALVDSLFLPRLTPVRTCFEAVSENAKVDARKAVDYSIKMNSNVVLKRLGYILGLAGTDIHKDVKGLLNNRFDVLEPALPAVGGRNKKWRLVINENLEGVEL